MDESTRGSTEDLKPNQTPKNLLTYFKKWIFLILGSFLAKDDFALLSIQGHLTWPKSKSSKKWLRIRKQIIRSINSNFRNFIYWKRAWRTSGTSENREGPWKMSDFFNSYRFLHLGHSLFSFWILNIFVLIIFWCCVLIGCRTSIVGWAPKWLIFGWVILTPMFVQIKKYRLTRKQKEKL